MLKGIDVSYAQGKPDWTLVKESGEVDFVYVKASDGIAPNGPDVSFKYNWDSLLKLGIPRGAYHFYQASKDPVKQAEIFFSIVGELRTEDLPPVIDVEVHPVNGQTTSQYAENVKKFMEKAEELFKRKLVVYTGGPIFNSSTKGAPEDVLNFISNRDLWLSAYVVNPNKFIPIAWSNRKKAWTIWQKSGDIGANNSPGKRIKGIRGVVDFNEFSNEILDLNDWIRSSYLTQENNVITPKDSVDTNEEIITKPHVDDHHIEVVIEQPTPVPFPTPEPHTKNWFYIFLGYIRFIISFIIRGNK